MKFRSVDAAQEWAAKHRRHIYVEIEGVNGVLKVYPGGRTIFRGADLGKIYDRYRKRLTPDDEFNSDYFQWKCREPGCGAVHLVYREHIAHLVEAHNLLGAKIIPQSEQLDQDDALRSGRAT